MANLTNFELLEVNRYLDQAEFAFVIEGTIEHVFPIRRKNGVHDFYSVLEKELRNQNVLAIKSYRSVKEGFARISRPATLVISGAVLLRERPHLQLLRAEVVKLQETYRFLDVIQFLKSVGPEVLNLLSLVRSCFDVMKYLIDHRDEVFGLLPRQIAHGQSTKLIGKENLLLRVFAAWRGEPSTWNGFNDYFGLVQSEPEYRFFAPFCLLQGQKLTGHHGILAKDWAHQYDFSELSKTLIVENLVTFYSVAREAKSTLVIWGGGWKAAHLRFLLARFTEPIFYWGDIDKEGYEIFGYLKQAYPRLQALFMDQAMIEKYKSLQQSSKSTYLGPYRTVLGLQAEYEYVSRHGIQIEQEQMREELGDIS